MSDLRKVINGLEHCLDSGDGYCYESECPYYQNECEPGLKADALSLLKALELLKADARVLTLEELRKAPRGLVLWNEWAQNEESELYPLEFQRIYMHTFPDGLIQEIVEFSAGMDYADEYGKQYRLWTAKPTDEQRKMVKWK